MKNASVAIVVACTTFFWAASASAFCGFYVSGADAELYNDATMVSLMREGKRTVLSMQNKYEGPAEDFAMVVPVPVVLEEEEVKTLGDEVFEKLDTLSAPRLVEYWERDPCPDTGGLGLRGRGSGGGGIAYGAVGAAGAGSSAQPEVKVEGEFTVGEYDIVILSSTASTALEDWLNEHEYNIPDGAAPYFKPYVQSGQYFFVAKVNMQEVSYEDGEAVLSPIRFHYDADDFALPVRLGLINSQGSQDLIAFILAKNQRYEVANFPNVTIPTNIPVKPETKDNFGAFYGELFDNVMKENPQAVVTEYSWNTATCDPCPGPTLDARDLLSLGVDALPSTRRMVEGGARYRNMQRYVGRDWVVTRLHTRYGKHTLGEDLVFQPAAAIKGGRGMPQGADGTFKAQEPQPAARNQFQGRYVIRHFWEGEVDCENPARGVWGGRGNRNKPDTSAAGGMAFQPTKEGAPLASFVDTSGSIPGLKRKASGYDELAGDVVASWGKLVEPPGVDGAGETSDSLSDDETNPAEQTKTTATRERGGCASDGSTAGGSGFILLLLLCASTHRRLR